MIVETSGPIFYLFMGIIMILAMLSFLFIKVPKKIKISSSDDDQMKFPLLE
jgi:hypothetical protein